MIRMNLLNVGLVEETGGILLILQAPEAARLLVIETGLLEGQAIALEAGGVRADRPLTSDLLYETIQLLGARVKEVQIPDFRDEMFFARIVLSKPDGGRLTDVEIDARPSDAIALALRARAPILVSNDIVEQMGIPEDRQGRFAELYPEDGEEPGERMIH